ncbi:RNA polymerase sigma-B factor [Sporotomaculum syntrophicum]|uniref:RNA polymerase sigma-B factor n=1 Tax=Sporotomaculum syntrophicum TaxID=182264 RepID=A0A9D2WS55_9FIRM|nr:sigma-70 family RNA polymerase sigma factor [Sporotomaculum syntrophicum]KAF1086580.1 RNA polymerase sigma-B factor [Sporotomaculum syntrophicum]
MIEEGKTWDAANSIEAAMADYLRCPDEQHLQRVVRAGSRLVHHFAKLYAPDLPKDDVLQAGFEGLIKSVKRYDPERSAAFATFASHYIMGEIRHYIRKEAAYYRPGWAANLQNKIDQYIEECLKQTGNVPEVGEIAAALNVREEGVIQTMRAGLVSFDDIDISQIHSMRYESFHLPIEDIIVLGQALEKLSELQRKVIGLLFYRDMTQNEVAEELGISQRKVSRILHKSLKIMSDLFQKRP